MNLTWNSNNEDFWNTGERRLIFDDKAPDAQSGPPEKKKTSEVANPDAEKLARDPKAYFSDIEDRLIEKIQRSGGPKELIGKHAEDVKRQIQYAKEDYLEKTDPLHPYHERMNEYISRVERRIEAEKRIANDPKLQEIYKKLDDWDNPRLIMKIADIFEKEKNPDEALKQIQITLYKETFLRFFSEKPADPNKPIDGYNRLGRQQMEKVLELLNVDLQHLSISAENLTRLENVRSMDYRFRGMTYAEIGFLDSAGNVKKEGFDRLLGYETRENSVEDFRSSMEFKLKFERERLGGMTPLFNALQEKAKTKYGKTGKLPTITFDGHPLDLNQIVQQNNQAYQHFSDLFKNDSLEGADEKKKQTELPKTLKDLFDFRFDENTGLSARIGQDLPAPIKDRLEAIGLKEPKAPTVFLSTREKIEMLEFTYRGEKMRIWAKKEKDWGHDDEKPTLQVFNRVGGDEHNVQKFSSTHIDLDNITQELQKAYENKTRSQKTIDEVNGNYFKTKTGTEKNPIRLEYIADWNLKWAKEDMLGGVVKTNETDRKPSRYIPALEKVIPMIVANAQALGINDDMTLLQAMVKIHQAPNSEELLKKDYSDTLQELKNPGSRHFNGIKAYYDWDSGTGKSTKELTDAIHNGENREFLARKESLAKLKIGDKLTVDFEGQKYSFKLIDSFAGAEYRFKLEGHDERDFKINLIDLVTRGPEDQLKHELGSSYIRWSMNWDRVWNGSLSWKDAVPLSMEREFRPGDLGEKLSRLPLTQTQKDLFRELNKTHSVRMELETNRYGEITYLSIHWQNPADQKRFTLESRTGNYWKLITLKQGAGENEYPFYDTRSEDVLHKLNG